VGSCIGAGCGGRLALGECGIFFSSDLHLSDISTKAMARNEGQGQAFVFGGEGHR
jgi:hypothetical protein